MEKLDLNDFPKKLDITEYCPVHQVVIIVRDSDLNKRNASIRSNQWQKCMAIKRYTSSTNNRATHDL